MKILIIRFSSLGDIVLTQPIVKRLSEVYPEAELHYLTKEQYQEIPEHFGVPLAVIVHQKTLKFHINMLHARYDYVFDLQSKLNSLLVKSFCWSAKVITYNKQHSLRKRIIQNKTKQEISSTLDLYRTALDKAANAFKIPGINGDLTSPRLVIKTQDNDKIDEIYPNPQGKKIIALFPGATHFTKMYPKERLIKLINMTPQDYHYWLLGSSSEKELCKYIKTLTGDNTTDYCGKFGFNELIKIVDIADVVITNDSGPMHIAAALEKKQIAIFGATHPKLGFKPNNNQARVICKNVICQPCSLHGGKVCPQQHFACMLEIEPEEILSIILTF